MSRKTKGRPDPIDIIVGQNLKKHRKLRFMSQQMLASLSNLSFQQIQKYEDGKNRISAGRLWRFSEILGLDINEFYEGVNSFKVKEDPAIIEMRHKVLNVAGQIPTERMPEYISIGRVMAKAA